MSDQYAALINPDEPMVYRIRLKGHLPDQWSGWFEGMTITLEDDGDTLLSGPVDDQAALHGLLKKYVTWACRCSRSKEFSLNERQV